ncbi:MAG: 4a-hydroxytetrahydrobiopterin dehydratase [Flavobacteriales bacterium]|nr:4a-hydroxytetrahydrobiopterin dehydratase [Flavobacteriales bacterium]
MSAWVEREGKLCRTIRFNDFSEAFAFMARVAMVAEKLNHHPEWTNTWNTVDIRLSTHDTGGSITEKDLRLAAAIDAIIGESH